MKTGQPWAFSRILLTIGRGYEVLVTSQFLIIPPPSRKATTNNNNNNIKAHVGYRVCWPVGGTLNLLHILHYIHATIRLFQLREIISQQRNIICTRLHSLSRYFKPRAFLILFTSATFFCLSLGLTSFSSLLKLESVLVLHFKILALLQNQGATNIEEGRRCVGWGI